MQLVSSITRKKDSLFLLFLITSTTLLAQSNSPYSRYGIGDLSSNINIVNRGMGGTTIASISDRFISSANPASYSFLGNNLSTVKDLGQMISFDVGTEFSSNTLNQTTPLGRYNTKNLIFNYMQFGTQLSRKGNWGMSFGLLPISRSNYKIQNNVRIPGVDSSETVYEGNGGSYKLYIGSAYRLQGFSFGFNTGYYFGKKHTSTTRTLLNDSIAYYESSSNNKLNFGNVFLQTGVLYTAKLKNSISTDKATKKEINYSNTLSIGASYELKNTMNTSTDIERFVYETNNTNNPASALDSILYKSNIKGTMVLPQTLSFGIRYERANTNISVRNKIVAMFDFVSTKWSSFRINSLPDAVQDAWTVKGGLELRPVFNQRNYWSRAMYRGGFSFGKDYIKAGGDMSAYTFSLGASLPMAPDSYTPTTKDYFMPYFNVALEYGRRGNNSINLRENFVRVAVSVSLSDLWYIKRKYD